MRIYNMTRVLFVGAVLTVGLCAVAQSGPPHLDLTSEQRDCLDKILGKPGEGPRPSREEFAAAASSCGVSLPAAPSSSAQSSSAQSSSSASESANQ